MPGEVDRDRLHWVNSCTDSMGKHFDDNVDYVVKGTVFEP
jgi:hypothetical protein